MTDVSPDAEKAAPGAIRRWIEHWRPSAVTMGEPIFPLAVLFGLNAVDELDRAAFAVLLPEIRDHFGMSDTGALTLVSITTIAVLLVGVPLSFYADRANRVRIAATGAAMWGVFSAATGFATSVVTLAAARFGAGTGRAVVAPTHPSLLSDYYEPRARVKVFSFHGQANSVGQILGPLLGGGLALWFGWRVPFVVFAVPTLVLVLLALRLQEPVRGAKDGGLGVAPPEHRPETPWSTMKVLYRVRTIRRIWCAVPFLAVALFAVPNLLSLVYEDVFDLDSGQRGLIAAAVEPLQIVGVLVMMPRVAAASFRDPGFLLRFVAIVGVIDGLLLVTLAYSPSLPVAIAVHALLAASIGTLAPAFFALMSMVAPARVRSASFTTIAVFAVPGLAVFLPLIGAVSDGLGLQAAFLVLVPVAVAAGLVLSSARRFVADDIAAALPTAPERPQVS